MKKILMILMCLSSLSTFANSAKADLSKYVDAVVQNNDLLLEPTINEENISLRETQVRVLKVIHNFELATSSEELQNILYDIDQLQDITESNAKLEIQGKILTDLRYEVSKAQLKAAQKELK